MTSTVRERRQTLRLDDRWEVVKWDASAEFVGCMGAALTGLPGRGVKAADVVAARVDAGGALLLVAEFKDYSHPDIPEGQTARAAERATSSQVTRDVVAKVIDSLCGAAFAHDTDGARCTQLAAFDEALAIRSRRMLVLYCAEVPKSVVMLAWTTELKRRLRWLGPRAVVIVTDARRPYRGNGITYSVS